MTNAFDLRSSLSVAASAAQEFGATDRQIDMIVALARGANDFRIPSGGRLTKAEASHIIDAMVAAGAIADYNKSDEELDAEDAFRGKVEAAAADRKAAKKHEAVTKAFRETQKLDAAKAKATGTRVRHAKFGEGDVIAEDDVSMTVLFGGQKKPLKMMRSFLTII